MSRNLTTTKGPALPGLADPGAEAREVIAETVAFWPEDGRGATLARPLKAEEKRVLHDRLKGLSAELREMGPVERERAAQAVAQMFLAFPSTRNIDAAAMVSAYVAGMQDLPLAAIVAACEDVAKGRVKGIDPDWPPTGPRLHAIAKKHTARPETERLRIQRALAGTVARAAVTKEERERVGAKVRELADKLVSDRIEEREVVNKAALETMGARTLDTQLRQYESAGVKPVYADQSRKTLLSLPFLLSQGWRIEEMGNERVLVSPTGHRRA